MKKLCIAILFIIVAAGVSFAADGAYQFEAGANISYAKDENSDKVYDYAGHFTYNFAPVNIGTHPLNEAAFLEKTSYIDFSGGLHSEKFSDGDADMYQIRADGKWLVPSTPLMLMYGFGYDRTKVKLDFSSYNFKISSYSASIGLGGYIMDGLFAGVSYGRNIVKYSNNLVNDDYNTNLYTVKMKYVKELNASNAINIEGSYEYSKEDANDKEKLQTYFAGADFYIIPQLGIGATFQYENSNLAENDNRTYGVRVVGFPMNALALSAGYEKTMAVNSEGTDDNRFYMKADYRF